MHNSKERARTGVRSTLLALAAAALAACGGGGGGGESSGNPSSAPGPTAALGCVDCGTLLVGLTDADGDFVSYSVDVLAVTLKRPNGATVSLLPATTRVDFSQLTDLADLLTVATVAPGNFVGGKIRLDYTNAEVVVESAGQMVPAKIVGEDGKPLGVVDLEIELSNREHLVITRGRAAFLSLDFDLAASNVVDLTKSPPTVTARPLLVAEVQPVDEKSLRVRGALVAVDTGASSYTVDLKPSWRRKSGDFGRVTVHTNAQTSFEVAGTAYTGAPGLEALSKQAAGTATLAFGTLALQSREFTASVVQAGDSVGGQRMDTVIGNVVSRNGNELTVRGAFAVHRDRNKSDGANDDGGRNDDERKGEDDDGDDRDDAHFVRTVVVTVGADTKVLKVGTTQALDAKAISVGQRIVASGKFVEPGPMPMMATTGTAVSPAKLDATAGRVRLEVTSLSGTVVSAVAGQLNLKLRAIDRLGAEMFDFKGTGSTTASDADPNNYEVATSTLPLAMLGAGEATKVLGFAKPFGTAPPDFEGRTIIDRRDLPTALTIGWGEAGTTAPFSSSNNTGLVLDLRNPSIGDRHSLTVGMRKIDLLTLTTPPTIAPASGRAVFGLWEPGHIELFTSFADFVTELNLRLGGGKKAVGLTATGSYDEATSTLAADHVSVYFAP